MSANTRKAVWVPDQWNEVVVNEAFTISGSPVLARGMNASDDGTITVVMADGQTSRNKMIFKGLNLFVCSKVTDLGGLTLEWFE